MLLTHIARGEAPKVSSQDEDATAPVVSSPSTGQPEDKGKEVEKVRGASDDEKGDDSGKASSTVDEALDADYALALQLEAELNGTAAQLSERHIKSLNRLGIGPTSSSSSSHPAAANEKGKAKLGHVLSSTNENLTNHHFFFFEYLFL